MYEPVTSEEVRRFGEQGIVERTAEAPRPPLLKSALRD